MLNTPNDEYHSWPSCEEDKSSRRAPRDQVNDIIQELQRQMMTSNSNKESRGYHSRKSSANPYLSKDGEQPSRSSTARKASIADSEPEYGLYNPRTGILLYQEDPDFDPAEDEFRLVPVKIASKRLNVGTKGGRKSPPKGQQTPSDHLEGPHALSQKGTDSSFVGNRVTVKQRAAKGRGARNSPGAQTRSKLHSELQKPVTQPPEKPAFSGSRADHEELKDESATITQRSTLRDMTIEEAEEQLNAGTLQRTLANVGDTTNPYSQVSRSRSRENQGVSDAVRKSIENRRSLRSQQKVE